MIDKAKTDAAESESSIKKGGVPVPGNNLQRCLELMRKVWEFEKRNAAPVPAILKNWGYGTKSSGGFIAIASLKRFGLLDEEGSNEKRTLKLSGFALDLLKNETVNPKEYQRLLKVAALNPAFHKEIWAKYGQELPSETTIESFLVFDKHFREDAAKAFIKQYKETISFAKLNESDSVEDGDKSDEESESDEKNKLPVVPPVPLQPKITPLNPMNTNVPPGTLPIPVADKIAMVPFPMTEEDFDLFIGTLQLWKKKLVRALSPIPPTVKLPANAVWKNNDTDKPVKIVAVMGEQNGELFYQSEDGTGIPVSQLTFS
jgi:hypothetical protein